MTTRNSFPGYPNVKAGWVNTARYGEVKLVEVNKTSDGFLIGAAITRSGKQVFNLFIDVIEVVNEETLFTIARCGIKNGARSEANARLIAAAPKMVKVLQRAAFILAELPPNEQTPRMISLREELIETINAATPEYYMGD